MSIILELVIRYSMRLADAFVYALFITSILNIKISFKKLILFVGLLSVSTFTLGQLLGLTQVFLPTVLVTLILVKLIFNVNITKSVISVGFLVLLSIILDFIIAIMISKIYNYQTFEQIRQQPLILLMANITLNLIVVLISLLIYYFNIKITIPNDLVKKRLLGLAINVLVTLAIVAPNIIISYNNNINMPAMIIVTNIISIILFFGLGVYNTLKNTELELKHYELENQRVYVKTLNNILDSLREFKHDYHNTLQTIGSFIKVRSYDKLETYFSQLIEDTDSLNRLEKIGTEFFNNPSFYGLILFKIEQAESKNINVYTELYASLEDAQIKTYHLCKILGILLDNAIEAQENETSKRIEILMSFSNKDKTISIVISNTFTGDVQISEIYKKGFSTKKNNTGIGLHEVQKILKKYENITLHTVVKDNMFRQELTIPAEPEIKHVNNKTFDTKYISNA